MHKMLFELISFCSHSGRDSCFTKMSSTVYSLGYDSKTALRSSDCASECLKSRNCGAVYVTAGSSCSLLQYKTSLPSSMLASHLESTQYYHRSTLFYKSDGEEKFELTLYLKGDVRPFCSFIRGLKCKQFLNWPISVQN